jgi:hypothetical protein
MSKPRILLVRLTADGRLDIDESDEENKFDAQKQPYAIHWILVGAKLRNATFGKFASGEIGIKGQNGSRPWPFDPARVLNDRVLVLQNDYHAGDPKGYWVYQLYVELGKLSFKTTFDPSLLKARSGKSRLSLGDDDCCGAMMMRVTNNPIIINR